MAQTEKHLMVRYIAMGHIFGITAYGNGSVFKIKTDGTGYYTFLSFPINAGFAGNISAGSLISDGTYFYGMTKGGGNYLIGDIFKVKSDGTGYQSLLSFNGATGQCPSGSLIFDGTYLYGMTTGPTSNCTASSGTSNIFKIKTDGTGFQNLHNFSTNSLDALYGSLLYDGTYLYGMSNSQIFKLKPDGTNFTILFNFSSVFGGGNHRGSLISDGTYLYGTTLGSINSVFKIKPDGTGYQDVLDLGNVMGSCHGDLLYDGTYLYGMFYRENSNANDSGVVFKIKPDGTGYVNMFKFNYASGYYPSGSLISDGTYLYGMTSYGGANNDGVVFKLDKNAAYVGIEQFKNQNTEPKIYPNPASSVIQVSGINYQNEEIKIYDVLGNKILQSKQNTFNISSLEKWNLLYKNSKCHTKIYSTTLN